MKRHITTVFLVLTTAFSGFAANYSLSWTPSPTASVTGYKVYSSTNGTAWKLERGVSGTNASFTNIPAAVMFFAVSATNAAGSESDKSTGEILKPPGALQIVEQ